MSKQIKILAFGGGVDSTALAAINLKRDQAAAILGIDRATLDQAFPIQDAVMFSDTGAERSSTYANIDRIEAACVEAGIAFHRVRNQKETITEWLMRLGCLPLMPGASHLCSLKFKTEVLHEQAEEIFPGSRIAWSIGIEANEDRRANPTFKDRSDSIHQSVYPLRNLAMNRQACIEMIAKLGFGVVTKSACVFCPFMKAWEIEEVIRTEPKAWAIVKAIEANFAATSPIKHQAWIDAGKPLNAAGRAPRGMWRKDSWAEGARLFVAKHEGKQLSATEWEALLEKNLL